MLLKNYRISFFEFFKDFFYLIYPDVCLACGMYLVKGESNICLKCLLDIPKTNYNLHEDNPAVQIFLGRVKLEKISSFFFFHKKSVYQHLIHQIKYGGKEDLGIYLGRLFASDLQKENYFSGIDFLIPVPLHPKKLRLRGYNQARCIAEGISQVSKVKILDNVLIRQNFKKSQTTKNRTERFENVKNDFVVRNSELIENKHCMIIDDVLTTGATIEVCSLALLSVKNVKVSVATLAFAQS